MMSDRKRIVLKLSLTKQSKTKWHENERIYFAPSPLFVQVSSIANMPLSSSYRSSFLVVISRIAVDIKSAIVLKRNMYPATKKFEDISILRQLQDILIWCPATDDFGRGQFLNFSKMHRIPTGQGQVLGIGLEYIRTDVVEVTICRQGINPVLTLHLVMQICK